jgi:3-oxoacyl-[acyl-carrier-protein] synthase-1
MRRVVVTGLGIVSCIGNNKVEVLDSLLNTKSGIVFSEEYKKYNFRSQVIGTIKNLNLDEHIDRKQKRFMGGGSAYNFISLKEAIKESGLEEKDISSEKTGIIMGSGGPSIKNVVFAVDTVRKSAPKRMGPYIVPRTMASTCSATLAVPFKIKGVNYSISSACATSGHCIGNGMELIQLGKQDIIFAGGGEELDWALSSMFDAMPALSSKFNSTPEKASRPYDVNRDGFVIAGGGGALVLEEYEHAKARGAKIYAELTGYGATSDGYDMVQPSGEGATRCMNMALKTTRNKVDYINSHGTSTPIGDAKELEAIQETFKGNIPKISSTKSLTGHSLGATSVHEAIYCLLMIKNKFIAASANIENMDEKAKNFPIVTKVEKDNELNCVMSNSFGFGGTNATLVFEKLD